MLIKTGRTKSGKHYTIRINRNGKKVVDVGNLTYHIDKLPKWLKKDLEGRIPDFSPRKVR